MAVSLGGGAAFLCVVQSVFMYAKCLLFQFIKEKTSNYIRKSHKVSTSLAVLQYFPESTGVLSLQYCSTFVEVLDFMNSTDFMKE